jgi:hypothetical protein
MNTENHGNFNRFFKLNTAKIFESHNFDNFRITRRDS